MFTYCSAILATLDFLAYCRNIDLLLFVLHFCMLISLPLAILYHLFFFVFFFCKTTPYSVTILLVVKEDKATKTGSELKQTEKLDLIYENSLFSQSNEHQERCLIWEVHLSVITTKSKKDRVKNRNKWPVLSCLDCLSLFWIALVGITFDDDWILKTTMNKQTSRNNSSLHHL